MIVKKILAELIEHQAQIEDGIKAVEAAKGEAGWLKVARGAIVTAIQNCREHAANFPQTEPTTAPAPTVAAPATTNAPALTVVPPAETATAAATSAEPTAAAPSDTVAQATNTEQLPKS